MIYLIVWAHFVSDFILQTDAMARRKSSSNKWLWRHILLYTLSLMIFIEVFHGVNGTLIYCFVNGLAHFITDYITSRITKRLWAEQRTHDFFVVIGLDQAIHMTTLLLTLPILGALR